MSCPNKMCISLILICFLVSTSYAADPELVQVINFIRHGARTPNSFEYRPNQYPHGFGELTTLGKLQAYMLGQEFRERYITQAKFLSDVMNPEEIFIKSSSKSRTMATAISFINGLYPQGSGEKHVNPYDINEKELLPLRNRYRNISAEELKEFTVDEEWAKRHIEVGPTKDDYFFHGYKDENCPLADDLIERHTYSLEANTTEQFFRENLYSTMEWQINTILGVQKVKKEELTIKKAKKLLDNFRCNTFHKLDHPRFNNLTFALLKAVMQYQLYMVTFREKLVRDVATTAIFESFLNFTQQLQDKKPTPKFILYSGHDTNLEPILYNLLSEKEILSREEYSLIPFLSTLSIYIYKEKTGSSGEEYFVQITFNDRTLPLDWCSPYKCPLSKFQEKLNQHIVKDTKTVCSTRL